MYFQNATRLIETFLACLTLFTLTNTASAAVFVVDDNYTGASSSACEQPAGAAHFNSIGSARLAAATNTTALPHTIRICPGSYAENNLFNDPEFVGMSIQGTTSNPSDVQITNVTSAIVFDFRQDKIALKNVTVIGGNYGVRTYKSDSTHLDNLIVKDQTYDGILIQSADNRVTNSLIEKTGRMGIYSASFGDTLLVQSIKINSAGSHCIYSNRGNETIKDVNADGCGGYGIALINAAGSSDNLNISNVKVNNTTYDGLYLANYDASAASDNVNIDNFQISNSNRFGMYLVNNDSISLSNITIDKTKSYGTLLSNTASSSLTNISIDNAGYSGFYLNPTSIKNQMKGLTISNSTAFGIYNNGGDDNTFEKLIVNSSGGTAGIYFVGQAKNNITKGYEVHDNKNYGVYLNNSQGNTFAAGRIYSNNQGVFVAANSASNSFIDNYIHSNTLVGLSMPASGTNVGNSFYGNCFINPAKNIDNLETGSANIFDNGTIGNFYGSVPAGSGYSEMCLDADNNAICDGSYTIPGGTTDKDNFPSRDLSSLDAACFSDALVIPKISLKKTSQVVSDPINLTTNPKAIPGSIIAYTIEATNAGVGDSDNDSIMIVDNIPANVKLVLGSTGSPIIFNDGVPASGLTYTFSGLSSTTDDVDFSNDGGATFITPTVGGNGVDITSPPINFIKISPKGVFNGDSGAGAPSFSITFEVEL